MKPREESLINDIQRICDEMDLTASKLELQGRRYVFKISKDHGDKFIFTHKLRALGWNATSIAPDDRAVIVFDV